MLRAAVVGCGKIADGHVTQMRATGRVDVVAVCDTEPLMAEQLAARYSIPGRYTDLAEMLEAERPDVVHIATPPASHLSIARHCVAAGCHVFMEKPFALNADDARQILEMAKAADRCISVNYLYNFETVATELRDIVARGQIGQVVHIDAEYGYNLAGDYGLAVLSDPGHWVHALPGKLFHNVLDHVLSKMAPYLRDDAAVQATAMRRREASGNPELDSLADELRFSITSAGTTAFGMVSAHGRPVAHTLRVVGSADTIELDYSARTLVHRAKQNQPSALGRLAPAWMQARRYRANARRNLREFLHSDFHFFQGMRVLLSRFYDSVEMGLPPPVPVDEILRVSILIDRIVESLTKDGY